MRTIHQFFIVLLGLLALTQLTSCDGGDEDVLASFTFKADATDFRKITFTNASQNFSTLAWNFGDQATSTETNPVHTYAAEGEYTVTLTATSTDGKTTDVFTAKVTVSDPDVQLTKLTGATSKTWKLLRDVSTAQYPLEVGPIDRSAIWWAMGNGNDELALRPCILNDEFTFNRDKSYVYDNKGDYWAEGGVFDPANECLEATAANMKGPNGEDLTAFGSGTHAFTITNTTLTVSGTGAFVGLCKIGTDTEVKLPQSSVSYDIVKLTDGNVDTLIIESKWKFANNTSGSDDAYWRVVLVHYDNPADEPALPNPTPIAGFTSSTSGLTVSFTNSTKYGQSYAWDFGDGSTSTEQNPTHTYADGGLYKVTLTATNAAGTGTATQDYFLASTAITAADLVGTWKVRADAYSVFVGPGMGNSGWWSVPKAGLDGSASGGDDWSCLADDNFIFDASGNMEYKTNGSARNDGYFGGANGCIDDATIAASGNGAAFGNGTHTYTFTAASGTDNAVIELTNGANRAAFLGFYKGYYGGENTDATKQPNGGNTTNRYEIVGFAKSATKTYIVVSVDISEAHDRSKAWSAVLEK